MSSTLQQNRWTANPEHFAACVQVQDVSGFFAKQLVIEPGTRALIIDEGTSLGEVPPGSYTIDTFASKLKFWKRKQATAVLARQEDFGVELTCSGLPTAEHLSVDATIRLSVQIEDVALFARNLMGTRPLFTSEDLRNTLQPLVQQVLWESIGRMSITDLTGPTVREELDAAIEQALAISLKRYGMRFVSVQLVAIRHPEYDEHRKQKGEIWLQKDGLTQQKSQQEIEADRRLLEIKKQEKSNELDVLAANVDIDKDEGKLAAELRRIGIRNDLRKAMLSEDFDKIKTTDDMQKFVHERDKGDLLRREEKDELVAAFEARKDDRESARTHLVRKLELERDMEVEQVRENLNHQVKVRRLDHEISLAKLTGAKENVEWERQVEKEKKETEHRRAERVKELDSQRQLTRQQSQFTREEEWDSLVQRQRIDRLDGEVKYAQAERTGRVARLEKELRDEFARKDLDTEKLRKEWELEYASKQAGAQIDKVKALNEMNHQAAVLAFELHERKTRLDAEIVSLKEDKTHKFEIARMEAMRGMSNEALIATANSQNAQYLAQLKMTEATVSGSNAVKMAEERVKMQKEMTDAVLQAHQGANQMTQMTLAQMQALLGQSIAGLSHSNTPQVFMPGVAPPMMPNQPMYANYQPHMGAPGQFPQPGYYPQPGQFPPGQHPAPGQHPGGPAAPNLPAGGNSGEKPA